MKKTNNLIKKWGKARCRHFFKEDIQTYAKVFNITNHHTQSNQNHNEKTVFYNLILESISQYFCCILFLKTKSLGPFHTQMEGITPWCTG